MSKILVVNAGSSSIKWSLFEKESLSSIASGIVERIGIANSFLKMSFNDESFRKEIDMKDHKIASQEMIKMWLDNKVITSVEEVEIIGFRVVHGGEYFDKSTKIGQKEITLIEECSKFAPLHNPGALMAIRALEEVMPKAKMSANFDTAFHTSIPSINSTYGINAKLAKELGIKKYGMHGISHRYITEKVKEILGKDKVNFVNMHIGNGASLCAVKDSKSFDTSMGFTPLAGVMMGTRSGDIDPALHEYVMNSKGISIKEFTNILNKESGLMGVSGISSDMRDLTSRYHEGDQVAEFALRLYSQKIIDYLVNYINKVGPKVDCLVFTAGVGENSKTIRNFVIEGLNLPNVNIKLDSSINEKNPSEIGEVELISSKDSDIPVYIIRTNEELMIAKDALKLYE